MRSLLIASCSGVPKLISGMREFSAYVSENKYVSVCECMCVRVGGAFVIQRGMSSDLVFYLIYK